MPSAVGEWRCAVRLPNLSIKVLKREVGYRRKSRAKTMVGNNSVFLMLLFYCLAWHSPLSDADYRSNYRLSESFCAVPPACMNEHTGDRLRKGYCIESLCLCEAHPQIYFKARTVTSTSMLGLSQLLHGSGAWIGLCTMLCLTFLAAQPPHPISRPANSSIN